MRSPFLPFPRIVLLALVALVLGGCGTLGPRVGARQAASVVDYLYPASQPPQPSEAVTRLKLPVRVGIAFVPAGRAGVRGIPESQRVEMLARVKASFEARPFIARIEVIPDAYLRAGGGFENLSQVARMFQLDVVCLLSYDQVQYRDDNAASLLYWTIVGAYVLPATKYSTHTLLDAAVFDVESRRLLFRAPGVSHVDGRRAPAAGSEYARESLGGGFNQALDQLVPALHAELDRFRERVKDGADAMVKVERRGPMRSGGAPDPVGLLLLGAIALAYARRR